MDGLKGGNKMFYALILNKQRQTHWHFILIINNKGSKATREPRSKEVNTLTVS